MSPATGMGPLCARYNAAALVVHHTGKDGDAERGSSALRGAADAMMALRPDGGGAKLESVKAKDAEPFESIRMVLTPTADSCVFELGSDHGALSPHERAILETLSDALAAIKWPAASSARPAACRSARSTAQSRAWRTARWSSGVHLPKPDGASSVEPSRPGAETR